MERPADPDLCAPVEARLRKSECALVVCGAQWPGARLHIDWQITGVRGLVGDRDG